MKRTTVRNLLVCPVMLAAASASIGQQPAPKAPSAPAMHEAKDITGDWQGSLKLPQTTLRLIMRFTRDPKGLGARFFSIDQAGAPPMTASSVLQTGNAIKVVVDLISVTYAGTLSPDGSVITGTWVQGANPALPLDLVRATKETAWEIPAPPAALKAMPADANPTFDVATIKPSDPGVTSMQALYVNGRNFKTIGSSLGDLVCFGYNVQMKQLVGTPDWLNKDRYDVDGVPTFFRCAAPLWLCPGMKWGIMRFSPAMLRRLRLLEHASEALAQEPRQRELSLCEA